MEKTTERTETKNKTAAEKLAEIIVLPEWIVAPYRSLGQMLNEEGISTCEDCDE